MSSSSLRFPTKSESGLDLHDGDELAADLIKASLVFRLASPG
jgi:hypothetical protein